jgi:hypothetical protein
MLGESQRRTALELAAEKKYQPAVRSPLNIALIADKAFGDFVLIRFASDQ